MIAAVTAGIGTLAGVLGTVAAVDGIEAALVVLVFLMFCASVGAMTVLAVHLAEREPDRRPDRRRAGLRVSWRPAAAVDASARTKGSRR
jgi:hypothetical protein